MSEKNIHWTEETLPTWLECRAAIDNYEYAKRNSQIMPVDYDPIPTALHHFVYEETPIDDTENFYFRERLCAMLNELPKLIRMKVHRDEFRIFNREGFTKEDLDEAI